MQGADRLLMESCSGGEEEEEEEEEEEGEGEEPGEGQRQQQRDHEFAGAPGARGRRHEPAQPEDDDDAIDRRHRGSEISESGDHEELLKRQLQQQLRPLLEKEFTVQAVLERIRPNADDEVSVAQVIARLSELPREPTLESLLQILQELQEPFAPKDAIMSIWFKLSTGGAPKRIKSAATIPVVRSRLLESKRKQAECDLKLLQNRIALLQQEETRAWKKIVQTKDRAQELLDLREANVRKQEEKSNLALERAKETRCIQKRHSSFKKESIIKKKHAAIQIISKKYQDVEVVKSESKRLKAEKERQQLLEVERAREKREAIRQQEEALKRKKEQERRVHEQSVALRYMKKVIDEERKIKEQQRQVEEMERQERQLIARLQGTQLIQQEAYSVLEQALVHAELRSSPAVALAPQLSTLSASASPLPAFEASPGHARPSSASLHRIGTAHRVQTRR
ncbi:hypothetical protein P43SY_004350 [Pythium insidiosum]|uniref:Uncharacterized protein n=1 Tax=Pythium insidiosum TaxID=114742 RepID=A0AAD5LFJ0_PYTIN|nr:hypothetical protein P43SY_004350 [Pythium insidiosum]